MTPKEALAEIERLEAQLERSKAEMLKTIAEKMDRARCEMRADLVEICSSLGARPDEIEAVLDAFDEAITEETRH